MNKKLFVCAVVLAAFCAISCGCKKGGLAGLVQFTGVVTYNGEPVGDVQLTFAPDGGGENARSALAKTAEDGTFTAMTLSPNDGILPGTYKITARKMTEGTSIEEASGKKTGGGSEGDDETLSDAETAKYSYLKDEVENVLPMKYASPYTSGLTVTIEKGGVKDFKIELTD
ncbi:MAG: carboxypeptidase regulatory-like domain-containing protein [Thermoguttaceae bacterium]|nr:carboxypeptidase regulatory-like domain-containing protein [Thermoguttaceae bacterium]